MTKHQEEVIFAHGAEDYHDVAGVLILRKQLRVAESREEKVKLPGLSLVSIQPRMDSFVHKIRI